MAADMEYMKDQQTFLDNTKRKIQAKPKLTKQQQKTVIGTNIITYELTDNDPSETLLRGSITFEGGHKREVWFLKSKETIAKKIFQETSKLNNRTILKVWFATKCEAIDTWIVCYDHFDLLLDDWIVKNNIPDRMRDGDDLLHEDASKLIRSLLDAIIYIHTQGLFHTELHLTSSYVVLAGEVKIINIGKHSLKDLQRPIDDATIHGLMMADLNGLKDLLKDYILVQPAEVAWNDRDLFFSFFELTTTVRYEIFVDKLLKHSFLMITADERMWSFFEIELCIRDPFKFNSVKLTNFISILESFEQYLDWDNKMGDSLRSVYEYEDEKVKRRNYDGQSVKHLLELLRNAYRHPRKYMMPECDKEVRNAYPGLLHRMHEALCRLEQKDKDEDEDEYEDEDE